MDTNELGQKELAREVPEFISFQIVSSSNVKLKVTSPKEPYTRI